MKTILVTGGAGYIGSITVHRLHERGYHVIVLDNLSRGFAESLPLGIQFVKGDIGDTKLLEQLFASYKIDAVMHFAAYAYVGESVEHPELYYENNFWKGLVFLKTAVSHGIRHFVFSSSCATYGVPTKSPVTEKEPQKPINPYGLTKLLFEEALTYHERTAGLHYVSLRYFNASGAAYGIGEAHDPETHLIPLTLQVALGHRPHIKVHGTDYATFDGTCVRDYVHVVDIADAHILALEHADKGKSGAYNLGTGKGYSVQQVINVCRQVTSHSIPAIVTPRRPGDPAELVASSEKIEKDLGWKPQFDLKEIIQSAWDWHKKHPNGYN